MEGKNPSILEKWWRVRLGFVWCCLFVREVSSKARSSPVTVTIKAVSLSKGVMVMTGVFRGSMLEVRIRPAIRLPQAKRLMGLIRALLFSLIGGRLLNRG